MVKPVYIPEYRKAPDGKFRGAWRDLATEQMKWLDFDTLEAAHIWVDQAEGRNVYTNQGIHIAGTNWRPSPH